MYIVDYLLELIIKIWLFGIFFSLKYDELGPFYFHEKSFAFVVIIFFRLKFASKRNNVPYISRSQFTPSNHVYVPFLCLTILTHLHWELSRQRVVSTLEVVVVQSCNSLFLSSTKILVCSRQLSKKVPYQKIIHFQTAKTLPMKSKFVN